MLAVELSSYQLHWSSSISAEASVVLNLAPDHLDWHGDLDSYAADKARIYHNAQLACVYNVQDPETERLVEEAEVIEGCRAIGFTLGIPAPGMVGLVDDVLADRAFVVGRISNAAELGTIARPGLRRRRPAAPHTVANALAAAALASAHGVPHGPYATGLRGFTPGRPPDRRRRSRSTAIRYVNDSKATNTAAALGLPAGASSARSGSPGGLAKGADFDELVTATRTGSAGPS